MWKYSALLIAAGCASALANDQHDCELGKHYVLLARNSMATDRSGAATYLQHAIEACPSYEAYEGLGETLAESPDLAEEKQAAGAFVHAYEAASSDPERAHTLYEYAQLLDSRGDAQNASPLILRARQLDAHDPLIATLAAQIQAEIEHPTHEGIVRGLKGELYAPLSLGVAGAVSGTLVPVAVAKSPSASVNIPINFETNSTVVDARTRSNIVELSKALQDPLFKDRRFVIIGHADERGSENRNLDLSRQRAQAIYERLLVSDPSLESRVEVLGKGSSEPIDPGHSDEAYRKNRRLQVILK